MSKIAVYFAPANNRSTLIAKVAVKGIEACGDEVICRSSLSYHGQPDCDVAVFYGLASGLRRIFQDYRTQKKVIFADLGYWGRRKRSRWDGYHKMVLNNRHPTDYFQSRPHSPERFNEFGIDIKPWRDEGRHILVVGMSAKAAGAEGLLAESWERETIARLRTLSKRPIVYRPKPNWLGARRIPGASFEKEQSLDEAFRDCHVVVAHHSNVAVDALMAGVPCICPGGVASRLSSHRLEDVESPLMPDGRYQWACDLAWTQFSVEEIESGVAWRALKSEGLIK